MVLRSERLDRLEAQIDQLETELAYLPSLRDDIEALRKDTHTHPPQTVPIPDTAMLFDRWGP